MKRRRGFTIVEVALVLVLSSLIFIAFIASIGPALSARRFNDSTQNFAEFLRSVYSSVENVQNNGAGNSDQAIYGKLVTFGELGSDTVYVYDILGKAISGEGLSSGIGILGALKQVDATVFDADGDIINQTTYNLSHGAWLETVSGSKFTGALLIARSPASGIMTTLYRENTIEVQKAKGTGEKPLSTAIDRSLDAISSKDDFLSTALNICVASDDQSRDTRRDVRLAANGSGTSAVRIISQESEENQCAGE